MNYQYRHGKTFTEATLFLYREGGVRRFYQGIGAALIQGASNLPHHSSTSMWA